MPILLFLVTTLAIVIATIPTKKEENESGKIILAIIGGVIIAVIGTSEICLDAWSSGSVGIQGACSYHGGVVTRLNGLGWIALIISIVITAEKCLNCNNWIDGSTFFSRMAKNIQKNTEDMKIPHNKIILSKIINLIRFFSKRFIAFVIDTLIVFLVYYCFFGLIIFAYNNEKFIENLLKIFGLFLSIPISIILFFVTLYIPLSYFMIMLPKQTVGQWLAGLKLTKGNGDKINKSTAFHWSLLYPFWMITNILYVNLVFLLLNKEHKSIIDLCCKTKLEETDSKLWEFVKWIRHA